MVDLSTITVLVIDEKRGRADGVREAVQRILPDATILVARPGDPWMEMAASRDPDMILVDTSTPGADGLDICRRLKKDERLSAIPVVAMTNREACMDTLSSALEAGIQGFLVEPLDPAQLLAQILSMARLKNSSRESQREFDRMLSMKAGHESALHASEKKYKALISRMMNAFALHEMIFDDRGEPVDYRFLEVNPAWERVVGIEANKVIGKTIKEIMPTIEEKWIRLYGRVVKTGISEEFTDYNAATNKYYEVYAFAVSGDQFAVFFNDVTPQIKTDLRLKESEEKFRSIAEALSDLIALTDEAGVIAYASPASSSIFGADPKEMAGRHFTDFVADSSISKAIEAFRAAISGEQRISKQEFLLKRLDGSLFFGEVTGAAHTIGSTHGALVTIRDIDERKQAEKQKQKQQARLQSFVRIIQHQSDSIQQFLDYALEELIQLTESQIGYICFYNENKKEFTLNTWSKSVMERCSLPPDSKVYRLENTGIWGEAVRQRKEIIVNDFSAPDPLKKGYPDGHVHLRNFLTVPIFEENQIVAVAGVGNKDGQYDEDDVLQMRLLMSNVWKEVVNKKGVLALAESEKRFSIAQELSPDGFTILRPIRNEAGVVEDFIWVYENPAVARINGTVPGEVVGKRLLDVFPNHRGKSVFNAYINAATTGTTQIIEEVFVENMIGKPLWLRLVVESMGEDIAIMAVDITEHKKNAERLRRMLDGTVNTILQILDTRDPYTAGHERRVAEIAMGIAAKMGLPPDQIDGLRTACLLHDVGKVIVPSEILSMPRKLSSVEFKLIQVHPESGYDILKDIEFPWPVARATLEHHERLDGSGYPRGLKGHELCLESKILAVADVVEAMSSHRPYRPSLGIDAALKEISSNRGILYDSEVVDACLFVFKEDARASLRQYR